LKLDKRKEANRFKAMELISKDKIESAQAIAGVQKQADEQTATNLDKALSGLEESHRDHDGKLLDLEAKGNEYNKVCMQALIHRLPFTLGRVFIKLVQGDI
jgi:hypothetical protein